MSKQGRRSRITSAARLPLLLAAAALLAVGCSYESSLGSLSCSEENSRSGGRVCRDGLWVAAADAAPHTDTRDADSRDVDSRDTATDVPDAPDEPDTASCAAGESLCNQRCVDLQTSADHCGACNQPCTGLGEHALASCEQGSCERRCAPGWFDANGDWVGTSSTGSTDGCELACTPTDDPTEICDGVDNDCDGQVDGPEAGCQCVEGETMPCYTGPSQTRGVGVCHGGENVCTAGSWGACAGEKTPGEETCGNDTDDDCDGSIDEGCPCQFDNDPDGVCGAATLDDSGTCQQPTDYEVNEASCDGLDNDCDGEVDEGKSSTFLADTDGDGFGDPTNTIAACSAPTGYVSPSANGRDDCDDNDADTYPGADEQCDERDNDCDGSSDDHKTSATNNWCRTQYSDNNLECDSDGPNGEICCELTGDGGHSACDFESNCHNGVDDDGDGGTDCGDPDCNRLYCAPGKTCQSLGCRPR